MKNYFNHLNEFDNNPKINQYAKEDKRTTKERVDLQDKIKNLDDCLIQLKDFNII